jgi:hypothetical protein
MWGAMGLAAGLLVLVIVGALFGSPIRALVHGTPAPPAPTPHSVISLTTTHHPTSSVSTTHRTTTTHRSSSPVTTTTTTSGGAG